MQAHHGRAARLRGRSGVPSDRLADDGQSSKRYLMKALFVFLAITAQAASLTQITWTVAGVGNTPATGSAIITLSAPCTWNGVYINTAPKYANIIAGSFTVSLVPNDACLANSLPNRTYYTVIWTINGQTVNNHGSLTQTWFVPTSATALDVSAVLASPNPPTYPLQSISPMQISQFGASVGQDLCWNGSYWSPGSCSFAGVVSFNTRLGAVVSQSGDYTTAQVTESGNLYFTANRAQAALAGMYQTPISGAPSTWPATFPPINSGDWSGTWQSHAPGYFQVAISGAPGTWPTLGTASSHAATDFEPALGSPGTNAYCVQSTTLGVRSWGPCGAPSQSIVNTLNVSAGDGTWLATPLSVDPTTGAISGPSTAPMLVQGVHQSASGLTTPATNQSALVFDSGVSDHTTRKDSSGVLHDLENTAGLNGVLKYTTGVPAAIGTSSTNCVREDGSSGACGGGSGAPVGSTPSISPSTGTYTSTQSATASCSRGNPFYCLGTLGSACASGATVTAYSTAVSVAASARFQAQCRDGGYDPGAIGYSDITISSGAPPAYVKTVCTGGGIGVDSTITCTGTATTPGNLIVVHLTDCCGAWPTVSTISDGITSYATSGVEGLFASADKIHYAQWFGYAASGSNAYTVTLSGLSLYRNMIVVEYSGAKSSSPLDTGSSAHVFLATTSGSSPIDFGGVTTTSTNELIVCGLGPDSSSSALTLGSGFGNLVTNNTANYLASEDRSATTATAYGTTISNAQWVPFAGGCASYLSH